MGLIYSIHPQRLHHPNLSCSPSLKKHIHQSRYPSLPSPSSPSHLPRLAKSCSRNLELNPRADGSLGPVALRFLTLRDHRLATLLWPRDACEMQIDTSSSEPLLGPWRVL
jgi:hypothetical protein